ncbi:MAG: efflux RND transporter periplasmic adaptor subunit [Chthoniobacter sp.]|nr:efflux RND transporter periplasmic adaptor subunit [Chthoniobacter sp.]
MITSKNPPPRAGRLIFIAAIVLVVAFIFGLLPRLRERRAVAADTRDLAQPTVAVVIPAPAKAGPPLVLSGELKPVTEASIHARVNGYVRRWLVDLGAKVEAGQLLAELDTPDTDRELTQVRAQLAQAEAARDLAMTTAKRWKDMLVAKTVSAQETDEKAGDLDLKKATVEAARANVQRLEQVAGFAKLTAPFAGTVTARRVDVGQLINTTESQELFHLVQTDKLRVFVRVPQNYARSVTAEQVAELTLPELPGKKFAAKVIRTAGALDPATRTLLTELEVDNTKGEILAGSYAQVRLAEVKAEPVLTLPGNAIVYRAEGSQVAVVERDHIAFRTITLGRDFGTAVEIRTGVSSADRVVVNPADSLMEGTAVKVVESK